MVLNCSHAYFGHPSRGVLRYEVGYSIGGHFISDFTRREKIPQAAVFQSPQISAAQQSRAHRSP